MHSTEVSGEGIMGLLAYGPVLVRLYVSLRKVPGANLCELSLNKCTAFNDPKPPVAIDGCYVEGEGTVSGLASIHLGGGTYRFACTAATTSFS